MLGSARKLACYGKFVIARDSGVDHLPLLQIAVIHLLSRQDRNAIETNFDSATKLKTWRTTERKYEGHRSLANLKTVRHDILTRSNETKVEKHLRSLDLRRMSKPTCDIFSGFGSSLTFDRRPALVTALS